MAYVPTIWAENMTTENKVNGLNNLETICSEGTAYIDAMLHDSSYYTKTSADSTFYRSPSHPSGRSDSGHGCHIDASSVDGYTKTQLLAQAVSAGIIAVWALTQASIPAGWQICDGTGVSPDLQGRILLCAGNGYNPGQTGGASSVTPTAANFTTAAVALTDNQIPKHQHTYTDTYNTTQLWGYGTAVYGPATGHTVATSGINGINNVSCAAHSHENSSFTWSGYYDQINALQSGALPILPPYKAYYYILKV